MYELPFHTGHLGDKRFLVTGGAGFIGSNIAGYLLRHGAGKVRVLDNFSTGMRENISAFSSNPAFELLEGDIRRAETCREAMEGIDYVSHQAALGSVPRSVSDPITSNNVNITGFLHVLSAARDAGVRRMAYAASSSTYGDHPGLPKVEENIGSPLSPYAVTKYANELYAQVFATIHGFNTVGLRYFNIYGPGQNPKGPYAAVIPLFIEAALQGKPPYIYGDGETSRDFTFVENAVQANIRSLLLPRLDRHEVLNVAVGASTTLNELWLYICAIVGIRLSPLYREERKGDVKHSLADISKAVKLIGYHPLTGIKEGLENTVDWYKRAYGYTTLYKR
jgi:UDP-N-acetylglucosamine 4-epimerase